MRGHQAYNKRDHKSRTHQSVSPRPTMHAAKGRQAPAAAATRWHRLSAQRGPLDGNHTDKQTNTVIQTNRSDADPSSTTVLHGLSSAATLCGDLHRACETGETNRSTLLQGADGHAQARACLTDTGASAHQTHSFHTAVTVGGCRCVRVVHCTRLYQDHTGP